VILANILQLVNEHANMGCGGVRDHAMRPSGCPVFAWYVHADGQRVTALIAGLFLDQLVEAFLNNGQFALVVEEHPSHETYQMGVSRAWRDRPA
jgi:hypothetical protein